MVIWQLIDLACFSLISAFIAVFGVILSVVFAMYEIQGQIMAGF